MQKWIDGEYLKVGDIGFLREICPHGRAYRFVLSDHPPHTNQSFEPRLHGWCGDTDNAFLYGRGMARVIRVAKNGRALVQSLHGDELREALEELGYPDLFDEDQAS